MSIGAMPSPMVLFLHRYAPWLFSTCPGGNWHWRWDWICFCITGDNGARCAIKVHWWRRYWNIL